MCFRCVGNCTENVREREECDFVMEEKTFGDNGLCVLCCSVLIETKVLCAGCFLGDFFDSNGLFVLTQPDGMTQSFATGEPQNRMCLQVVMCMPMILWMSLQRRVQVLVVLIVCLDWKNQLVCFSWLF